VHGFARLWDAHSIANQVPRLFEGTLPDLNMGTNGGQSCGPILSDVLDAAASSQTKFSHVFNGRFKGGYITRHYGNPGARIEAVQLELSQSTYMNPSPGFSYREGLAAQVQPLLSSFIQVMASTDA
jgi:N-formylglutamate amidohydrolase